MAKNMGLKKSNCATVENGNSGLHADVPKKNVSFLWLLSQPFLQDCSLAASEVDLGEHEATALCSIIYWTYRAVTALASLLVTNKGLFTVQMSLRGFCLPPSYTT